MKKTITYETPAAETVEVYTEGYLATSTGTVPGEKLPEEDLFMIP